MKGNEQVSKSPINVGQFLHMSEKRNRRRNANEDVEVGEFLRIAEGKSNRITKKNIYEIKNRMKDTKGFDLFGNITIEGVTRKTNMRFRSVQDFEAYIEKIDDKYDGDEVIFTGQSIEYDVPQFNPVKRSNYGKRTIYLADIEEYHGNNCFITTGILKCINFLIDRDFTKEYFEFITSEDRRKNVLTIARIQPFVSKYGIDIGTFIGERIKPESGKERRKCLFLHINHFCVLWGSL